MAVKAIPSAAWMVSTFNMTDGLVIQRGNGFERARSLATVGVAIVATKKSRRAYPKAYCEYRSSRQ